MPDLAPALTAFVRAAEDTGITWMLVGSMATRLQGAYRIQPGDIDILVHPDTDDSLFGPLAAALCQAAPGTTPGGGDLATFRSTPAQPLIRAGAWTFGRWYVNGVKLEVARIRERLDAGLLENQGRATWACRRKMPWHGHDIPVVPLEVQWATITERGQVERMRAIADGRVAPWDQRLARQALIDRGLGDRGYPTRPSQIS